MATNYHKLWTQQVDAAWTIKQRYGLSAAFDYIVGEKLMNHAEVAERDPKLAAELPGFVSELRKLFRREEIISELDRLESKAALEEADLAERALSEDEDSIPDDSVVVAARKRRFSVLRELLTAARLGIS